METNSCTFCKNETIWKNFLICRFFCKYRYLEFFEFAPYSAKIKFVRWVFLKSIRPYYAELKFYYIFFRWPNGFCNLYTDWCLHPGLSPPNCGSSCEGVIAYSLTREAIKVNSKSAVICLQNKCYRTRNTNQNLMLLFFVV